MRTLLVTTLLISGLLLGASECTPKKEKVNQTEEEVDKTIEAEETGEVEAPAELTWEKVDLKELSVEGYYPHFTNDGKAIVYSTANYNGLWLYNLADSSTKQLTDQKGAGFKPAVLEDNIIYQVRARLKYLEQVEISTGTITKVSDNEARFAPGAYVTYKQVLAGEEDTWVRTSSDLFSIEIMEKDNVRAIAPVGKKNYVNPSFSPDKEMILFEVIGQGGYISDLNGNIIKELGEMDMPSWIDNNLILYALSKDDGMQTLSSEVYVLNIDSGEKYHLSKNIEEMAENPKVDSFKEKIVANSPDGKLFLISKTN
ncbi:MAG: hypothetical protein ABFS32_07935 [Bacteroidota bacterium]